jgi:hypothetical protein
MVYENLRLVKSRGSVRLLPPSIILEYIRGPGLYGKRMVVATWSTWEVRVGATVVSVEMGSGEVQWYVPQWVAAVDAAKRTVREWPASARVHLHPLLVAWSESPTLQPIPQVVVPATVQGADGAEVPNPAPYAGELVAPRIVAQ